MIWGKLNNKIWPCSGALTRRSGPDLKTDTNPVFIFWSRISAKDFWRGCIWTWKLSSFFVFSWKIRATSSHILFVCTNEWCIIHSLINKLNTTTQMLCSSQIHSHHRPEHEDWKCQIFTLLNKISGFYFELIQPHELKWSDLGLQRWINGNWFEDKFLITERLLCPFVFRLVKG